MNKGVLCGVLLVFEMEVKLRTDQVADEQNNAEQNSLLSQG
jgi:hypothetical protein